MPEVDFFTLYYKNRSLRKTFNSYEDKKKIYFYLYTLCFRTNYLQNDENAQERVLIFFFP